MAVYRYQVVSVGMWRGKIKRWNTTFHGGSNTYTGQIYSAMQTIGYKAPGDVAGACSGGIASIAMYAATGGAPLSRTVYFDWQMPAQWIPYDGSVWASIPDGTPVDAAGESALVYVGILPGLSKTGKPMSTRKYFHAVPSRTALSYLDPDVPEAVATAVALRGNDLPMSTPAGITAVTREVLPYYGNHQRVRGRRKTTSQVAAQSFSNGVVVGSGAAPFPAG